jgi:hypothetical protein
MEIYRPDEIIDVVNILETVQDVLVAEGEYISDELYDMIQEAIEILSPSEEEK